MALKKPDALVPACVCREADRIERERQEMEAVFQVRVCSSTTNP